jgi:hypothetical protein
MSRVLDGGAHESFPSFACDRNRCGFHHPFSPAPRSFLASVLDFVGGARQSPAKPRRSSHLRAVIW